MYNGARSTAEVKFAASQKAAKRQLKEKEEAQRARTEKMAKLRALRLARETAAEQTAEDPPSATGK